MNTTDFSNRDADELDDTELLRFLTRRLGAVHAKQRMGIESEADQQVFGGGINFFHPENWYSAHALIGYVLKLSGLYWIGRRNTLRIQVRHNDVAIRSLPAAFDGYTLLHISDLHADMYPPAIQALAECVSALNYDVCVLTGDYRAQTFGPVEPALRHLSALCTQLSQPVFGVLGNHDSIRMLPGLEAMGVHMLLNESFWLERGGERLMLVGIDDAHYFRADNLAKAVGADASTVPKILLSHTPEIYRQAAHAGFSLMLSGHTHGGQICLPGGYPVTLDAKCPRYMGSGAWEYHGMAGYTSVGAGTCIVPVRLNCLPEVVLHHLRRA